MSTEKDIFKDVFSEKFGNYEVKVNPELWNSISSKIVSKTAISTAAGTSFVSKIIIGSSILVAVATGTCALHVPDNEVVIKDKIIQSVVKREVEDSVSMKKISTFPSTNTTAPILNKKKIKQEEENDIESIKAEIIPVVIYEVAEVSKIVTETPVEATKELSVLKPVIVDKVEIIEQEQ